MAQMNNIPLRHQKPPLHFKGYSNKTATIVAINHDGKLDIQLDEEPHDIWQDVPRDAFNDPCRESECRLKRKVTVIYEDEVTQDILCMYQGVVQHHQTE